MQLEQEKSRLLMLATSEQKTASKETKPNWVQPIFGIRTT